MVDFRGCGIHCTTDSYDQFFRMFFVFDVNSVAVFMFAAKLCIRVDRHTASEKKCHKKVDLIFGTKNSNEKIL